MTETTRSNQTALDEFNAKLQDIFIHQTRKLLNSKIYIKSLLSTLPVALIATDEKGQIKTVNRACEDILGLDPKKVEGKVLGKIFQSNSDLLGKMELSLSEGRQFQVNAQSLHLDAKGDIVANIEMQPILNEEREICGLLLSIEDQTYVNFLKDAFKRYVPPSVSEIIAQDPQYLKLGGEEKELTVLFSDLIGFTTLSEKLSPHQMVTFLSDYFDEMTALVFENEGTLKEYVADELMAIFGAPVYQPDHAKRACRSALSMSKRLKELRRIWAEQGRPQLRARIGVNTGPMLVGNLGSTHRFSYGVIGDHVNLGSRLEGLSSLYGTEILIGENTKNVIDDEFHIREIDFVRVKGRNQPVRIFELLDNAENPLPQKIQKISESYGDGLSLYREKDWIGALNIFKHIQENHDDRPTHVMAQRCRIYIENPPSSDWDGVFEHKTK
mgnify:CR=1 FL=1